MTFNWQGYKKAIENEFTIVNKDGKEVRFILNKPQDHFIQHVTGRDFILKARQEGFSSEILGIGACKFIFGQNERCVSTSHETSATQKLLDRVKFYLSSFEKKNGVSLPLKYNSRTELVYGEKNNSFYIGTAGARDFGRGDTITFLHASEFLFYQDPERFIAGVMQAVVPDGLVFLESTANGFNEGKAFWDKTVLGLTGFKNHFYGPEWVYTPEFLEQKKKELGRFFPQEYPSSPEEAFLTSGDLYFNYQSLKWYLDNAREVISENLIYG
jgi:hypothetical protein